jgi:tetratricopeptide (TPR) repeat protein
MGAEAAGTSNEFHGNVVGSIVQARTIGKVVLPPSAPAALSATVSMLRDLPDFSGRGEELDQLFAMIDIVANDPVRAFAIHAVDGMAGVGKTVFCVHAAHRLADRFPDGQLFLELHGNTPDQEPVPVGQALASLLLAMGVDPKLMPLSIDDRARLWRDRAAHKQMLVVLDDALDEAQVRPLLPGSAKNLVLITSRHRLGALEGVRPLSLEVPSAADAVRMLARISGRDADSAEDATAMAEIVRRCGYLPLAIALMAAQLRNHPRWDAGYLAGLLAEAHDDLGALHVGDRSVRGAFQTSFQNLPPARQRGFRLLGLFPSSEFDAYSLAALTGDGLDQAREDAEALYQDNLVQESIPGRYRSHDLVRSYARYLARELDPDEHDQATRRVLNYYLQAATLAATHLPAHRDRATNPPEGDESGPVSLPRLENAAHARKWLTTELPTLIACQDLAAAGADKPWAVRIAAALQPFFLRLSGDMEQALLVTKTALDAATDTGDRLGRAVSLNDLGHIRAKRGEYPQAVEALTEAYDLCVEVGDRAEQADTLLNLGMVKFTLDDYTPAADYFARAHALYAELGDRLGQARALDHLSKVYRQRGEYSRSDEAFTKAADLYAEVGDPWGRAKTLEYFGAAQYTRGQYAASVDSYTKAYELYIELGDRWGQGNVLANLGIAQRLWGRVEPAIETLTRAYDLYIQVGFRMGQANVLTNLGCLYHQQGAYPTATETIERAYDLFVRVGDRDGQAETLNNFGNLAMDHAAAGDPHAHFTGALAIAREIGTALHEARALHGLARCALRHDDTAEAIALLRQAQAIYRELETPESRHVDDLLAALASPP